MPLGELLRVGQGVCKTGDINHAITVHSDDEDAHQNAKQRLGQPANVASANGPAISSVDFHRILTLGLDQHNAAAAAGPTRCSRPTSLKNRHRLHSSRSANDWP